MNCPACNNIIMKFNQNDLSLKQVSQSKGWVDDYYSFLDSFEDDSQLQKLEREILVQLTNSKEKILENFISNEHPLKYLDIMYNPFTRLGYFIIDNRSPHPISEILIIGTEYEI